MSKTSKTSKGATSKTSKGKQAPAKRGTHANGAEFSTERPGVLASIVALLRKAHPAGVSKGAIVAALVREYPDRDEGKMKSTVAMQVPSGLRIERGYALTRTLRDGAKLFSLAPAEESKGDEWRTTKRNDPKGAGKLMLAIKARAAQLIGSNDNDE
jgi:hypothetical protein